MARQLSYERFFWFNDRIKLQRYPNTTHLMRQFEISESTAQRTIDFMRDRLGAPLQFDRTQNGYFYTDEAFELPGRWINQSNVLALALTIGLASSLPDRSLADGLCNAISQTTGASGDAARRICVESALDKVSVKSIEQAPVADWCFTETARCLLHDLPLRLRYHSPYSNETRARIVQPLHLTLYMGNWYLLAWCTLRRDIRMFNLYRVEEIEQADKRVEMPDNLPPVKELLERDFGIMQGERSRPVVLRFSARAAAWVKEQLWHPGQIREMEEDGGLQLTFPAADFRELVRRVLAHGGEVTVVEPPELREMVLEEIEKMKELYL